MADTELNQQKEGCGCCRGRVVRYITPLLLGGLIGYLVGSRCGHKMMCPVSSSEVSAPAGQVTPPANTAPK
jgi:hypothetical protein